MKLLKQFILLILFLVVLMPNIVLAQSEVVAENNYYKGEITKVISENYDSSPDILDVERFSQIVEVRLLDGPNKNNLEEILYTPGSTEHKNQKLEVGEKIIIIETKYDDEIIYNIADHYRFNTIIWLVIGFFILVILFTGFKGFRSIIGLAFTIGVILMYIMPSIINGSNPVIVFIIGGFLIAFFSIYLGHGFNRRTSIAVLSTLITLIISIISSILVVNWAKLFGLGSEEAFLLQVGDLSNISLQGLLLGGMIIGILGVLDDITTAQAAAVEEIYRANPKLSKKELLKRGLSVGHEHIISLVNTLVLAYAGVSFPLLLLFTQSYTPTWVLLNSENIVEEIVRTLVGSSALVIAVPITTYLAVVFFSKFGINEQDTSYTPHHH